MKREERVEERMKFQIEDHPGPGYYVYDLKRHVVTPKIVSEKPWYLDSNHAKVLNNQLAYGNLPRFMSPTRSSR